MKYLAYRVPFLQDTAPMLNLLRIPSAFCALVMLSTGPSILAAQSGQADARMMAAQSNRILAEKLDSIAGAGVRENSAVGIVVAVVRGKETLLLKAYGKSDVEGDVPMTVTTVVPIGSVTKQFTAAAILQLRDAGKLSLDDEITRWLPEYEARGKNVTLRHLLGHMAGVVNLGEMQELRAVQLMRNPNVSRDSVYNVIRRYPFQFPAGTMQVYSNTGFWLLGLVIEKASGITYEDYVEKRIFEPLGMSRSMYCNNSKQVPGRAHGYGMRSGMARRVPDIVHTGTYAAGAICSTVEDMITWLQALHGGKVLTPRSYAEMIAPSKLNDGTSTRYSMGLIVWKDSRGLQEIGHGGGGFGFSSQAWWHPDTQLAIVLLTNSEPDNTTAVAEALAAQVLPPARPVGAFTGDASLLAGTYKSEGRGGKEMVIAVTQTPQWLAFSVDGAAPNPLQWVETWAFRRNASLLIFRRGGNSGPATELRFDTGGDHFILKRQ
jgi:CubicO group peptidase (beta-lactamase class C family)